jgi:hypothetical protein
MINCSRTKDLTGQNFDRLTVLSFAGRSKNGRALWKCKCSCGNEDFVTKAKLLLNGDTKSCGCLKLDKLIERSTKHGQAGKKTPFYCLWKNLRQRCNNSNDKRYKDYGGRGITYDKRWNDFLEFKKDMYQSYVFTKKKYRKVLTKNNPLSIERKDVNGNYCKENCIFITMNLQAGNTRNSRWFFGISPKGKIFKSKNQCEFARKHNLNRVNISQCLRGKRKNNHKGWQFFNFLELKRRQ